MNVHKEMALLKASRSLALKEPVKKIKLMLLKSCCRPTFDSYYSKRFMLTFRHVAPQVIRFKVLFDVFCTLKKGSHVTKANFNGSIKTNFAFLN